MNIISLIPYHFNIPTLLHASNMHAVPHMLITPTLPLLHLKIHVTSTTSTLPAFYVYLGVSRLFLQPAVADWILAGGPLSIMLHELCVTSIICILTSVLTYLSFCFGTLSYSCILSPFRVFFIHGSFPSLCLESPSVSNSYLYPWCSPLDQSCITPFWCINLDYVSPSSTRHCVSLCFGKPPRQILRLSDNQVPSKETNLICFHPRLSHIAHLPTHQLHSGKHASGRYAYLYIMYETPSSPWEARLPHPPSMLFDSCFCISPIPCFLTFVFVFHQKHTPPFMCPFILVCFQRHTCFSIDVASPSPLSHKRKISSETSINSYYLPPHLIVLHSMIVLYTPLTHSTILVLSPTLNPFLSIIIFSLLH